MSFSIGGSKGKNKGTSSVDNSTQEYMKRVREAAAGAGASGPSPLVTGATDYYGGAEKAGNMGMGALSGDPNATARLMNPYQQQVINANNAEWNNTDQNSINEVNDRATRAGAFGGTRQGVATGVALGANNRARMGQNASLLYGGFNDAMGRANNLSTIGMQGADNNANLGMGGVGNQQQWMMEMLKRGYLGPMGGQTNGSGYSVGAQGGYSFGGK